MSRGWTDITMEISRQWKRVTRCVTNQVVGKLTSEGAKRPSRDKMFNRMGTTKLWENKFLNVQYIYSSFDVHAKLRRLEKEVKRVVVGRNVGIRWPKWPKRRKTLNRGEFSRRRQNVKRTQATRALRWKLPKTGQNHGILCQNDGIFGQNVRTYVQEVLPRQRNGPFLCRGSSVPLLHKLKGRGPAGGCVSRVY